MKKKMIHSLRVLFSELERGILSPAFVFCVIATAAVLFFGSTSLWFPSEAELEGGLAWEYYLTMLDTGCRSEAFVFCLPLLAAFPAGISVLTDVRSGFIKEYLGRSGSRPYVVSKVILSVLSGGGGVLGGYLTAAGLMFMIYGPMELAPGEEDVSQWQDMWPQALVVFLAGAFFAMLAATLGLVFRNRYMAFGGAFMVSYLLIIVTSRYLTGIYTLNPREWFRQEHYWEGGYFGCGAFLLELCVIMALIYGQTIFRFAIGGGKKR